MSLWLAPDTGEPIPGRSVRSLLLDGLVDGPQRALGVGEEGAAGLGEQQAPVRAHEEAHAERGLEFHLRPGDVTDREALASAAAQIVVSHGRIDLVVAAVMAYASAATQTPSGLHDQVFLDLNALAS